MINVRLLYPGSRVFRIMAPDLACNIKAPVNPVVNFHAIKFQAPAKVMTGGNLQLLSYVSFTAPISWSPHLLLTKITSKVII